MTLRNRIAAWTAELGDLITSLEIGRPLRDRNWCRGGQSARMEPRRALDLAQLEDRVMLRHESRITSQSYLGENL
jgi:hypothetical protein